MLQPLGLFVNLVPLHAEDFAQHALDQVVANGGMVGVLAPRRGEAHNAVLAHFDVAVALQALERHGDGRRRDLKPVGQHGRNHLTALGFGLQNGLEVVLLRDVDRVFHRGT